jgi:hypothetical protein
MPGSSSCPYSPNRNAPNLSASEDYVSEGGILSNFGGWRAVLDKNAKSCIRSGEDTRWSEPDNRQISAELEPSTCAGFGQYSIEDF